MSGKRTTAVTSEGVLTFDGEVVETFGHSFDKPIRAHVAMLKAIEVAAVSDAARAAAPNLESA
jgi:hypothetical protein